MTAGDGCSESTPLGGLTGPQLPSEPAPTLIAEARPEGFMRVARVLAEAGHPHLPLWLEVSARTSAEAAEALGVHVGQIAKSVVFRRRADQVAVLVVASTQPEAIEQYALRAAEAWRLAARASTTACCFWWHGTTAGCASRSAAGLKVRFPTPSPSASWPSR